VDAVTEGKVPGSANMWIECVRILEVRRIAVRRGDGRSRRGSPGGRPPGRRADRR
jgi:hypothetical protein